MVCSANGNPSLPEEIANTCVSSKETILKIQRCDIKEVLIDSSKSTTPNIHPKTSYSEEILFARDTYTDILDMIKVMFETVESNGYLDVALYEKKIDPLIDSIERNSGAAASLTVLAQADKYLFSHSLNTAILSAMLGRFMGLSRESITQLSLAAILMNIGKIWIPDSVLKKKGKLTKQEFATIKEHPVNACKYLSKQQGISLDVIKGVLSHHERDDSSGYPEGISGHEIHKYARIIAICDSYDAMTSDRPYREAMTPNMAIKHLYSMKTTTFHPRYIESFIKCVGIYPVGCFVKLSDGSYGIVLENTPQAPLQPQIKIVFDSRLRATHPKYIDLAKLSSENKRESLEIEECIHPKTFKLELSRFLW